MVAQIEKNAIHICKLWQNEKWKYFDQANLVKQRCLQNFPGVETRQLLLSLLLVSSVSDVQCETMFGIQYISHGLLVCLLLLLLLVLLGLSDHQQAQQRQGGNDATDQQEARGSSEHSRYYRYYRYLDIRLVEW